MSPPFVEINDLTKSFGKGKPPALEGINTSFSEGKIVGLVGPDGAGKTTLIRIMAGLLTPTVGNVTIMGYDSTKDAEKIHEIIGYMPQKFGLYEDLSVIQNMELYAELQGVAIEEKKAVFDRLLDFTGLTPFTKRLAGNLSGGMKQKLGLACSLIKKPELLLLDEPSVGVDPISRRELWKLVSRLAKEGITVLWSTSYLDEAEKCEEVLLLHNGNLLFDKEPQALTSRVEGRVYQIQNIKKNKRLILTNALQNPAVLDGVIQGKNIRLVLRENSHFDNATLTPVPPRFEDAFMDILGGGPGGKSLLAEQMKQREDGRDVVIEADHLIKKFGNFTAVDNVSFSVKRGEVFGLLGPNGAGKSTTFRMICGLINPTGGYASVSGIPLSKAPTEARAKIGYMAQKFSLYDQLTSEQNLNFFSGVYGLKGDLRRDIVENMVNTFDLKPYFKTPSGELPLGFKQRLALACAVMHQPRVLFLDEPTSGVDPLTRREFWNHINGMVEKGTTIILSTHFIEEAEYCDHIGLIHQGKLIAKGTPDSLKERVENEGVENPTLEDAFIHLLT